MIPQTFRSYTLKGYVLAPLYHDMTVEAVRQYLLEEGKPIIYGLEPGDGTRYTFLLCPVTETSTQKGLYITRLGGRTPEGWSAVLWDWDTGSSAHQIEEAADAINVRNHPHTAVILRWFLAHLCNHFDHVAGSDRTSVGDASAHQPEGTVSGDADRGALQRGPSRQRR